MNNSLGKEIIEKFLSFIIAKSVEQASSIPLPPEFNLSADDNANMSRARQTLSTHSTAESSPEGRRGQSPNASSPAELIAEYVDNNKRMRPNSPA
jgi:hypothetical protein